MGHKISRKNKQAPLVKLLPELTKPWSRPQLHKQEGKLTKKKGPTRASGAVATRRQLTQELQARNDGELNFSAANSKTAKHKDAQKRTRRIRELELGSGSGWQIFLLKSTQVYNRSMVVTVLSPSFDWNKN
jgi:hypothetical protein